MTLAFEAYPRAAAQVYSRQLDGEAVVTRPDKGEVKVLNEVGARIWALSDGAHSVRDIAAILSAEYQVTLAEAEADTLAFLAELQRKGLITV